MARHLNTHLSRSHVDVVSHRCTPERHPPPQAALCKAPTGQPLLAMALHARVPKAGVVVDRGRASRQAIAATRSRQCQLIPHRPLAATALCQPTHRMLATFCACCRSCLCATTPCKIVYSIDTRPYSLSIHPPPPPRPSNPTQPPLSPRKARSPRSQQHSLFHAPSRSQDSCKEVWVWVTVGMGDCGCRGVSHCAPPFTPLLHPHTPPCPHPHHPAHPTSFAQDAQGLHVIPRFYFPGGKPVNDEVRAAVHAAMQRITDQHPDGLPILALRVLLKEVRHGGWDVVRGCGGWGVME